MIQFENVSKKFGSVKIYNNINLTIPNKCKTAIIGANGSGKSVLLKLIVGYSSPSEGTIKIDDQTIHKDIDFIPNAGVSINAPEFIGSLTGFENLIEIGKVKKIVKKSDIINLAIKLDFEKDLNRKYKTYSLGMKQKMRLIQAVMEHPKYLILDEPFDGLDQKSKRAALDIINEYVDNFDSTLVFTNHGDEVFQIADVIYEIKDNNLIVVKGEELL